MMLLNRQILRQTLIFSLISCLFVTALVTPAGLAQTKLATPTTHLVDNADNLTAELRQPIENILSNLQLRSGINFAVVIVKTTEGRDIYDFSFDIAKDWDIGLRTSANKSLLLVIAVEDKINLTQISKGAAKLLPEGALGELSQRIRTASSSAKLGEGLLTGLQQFALELSEKMKFSAEGMEQAAPLGPATVDGGGAAVKEIASAQPPADTPAEARPTEKSTRETETSAAVKATTAASKKKNTPQDDEAEAEAVAVMQTHTFAERVVELKDFVDSHPDSKSKARAIELLVSSRAALGDEKLRAGDRDAGVEQLLLAISDSPADISEKLFSGVITQIPFNLYLRGEQSAAFNAAQTIEKKFGGDAKHLLGIAGFYLSIERGDEAARLAEQAVKLAPEMAAAYDALGLALHISLRLDEAAAAYQRALELDPKTPLARRSLADLNRSAGKTAEALTGYRAQLAVDPTDKNARAGLVLTLYETGETAEADKEFDAAIKDNPRNVTLLAGAAYWFIAHGQNKRGLDLAKQAADVEPRYTWGQIALARALIADNSPEYAEACVRFARQHGRFPTLDYELANALAAMGLYEEAGVVLKQSFSVKDGVIETRLANGVPAHSESFIELLAPERRASIFQPTPADTESNARRLKALLTFTTAISPASNEKIDEAVAVGAAREFAAGEDDMRAYRQLYASQRLLQRGIGFTTAQELADAARKSVNVAIAVSIATIAVQADELQDLRARTIASGGTPDIPDAPRNVLANILRGRIEDLSGWALLNQDKTSDAIARLRLAVGIIPEQTPSWLTATWHLASALEQDGKNDEALTYYIKAYNSGASDNVHRTTIEQLFRKVNGSLDGLDDRIGPVRALSATAVAPPSTTPNATEQSATPTSLAAEAAPTPGPTPTPEPVITEAAPSPSPTVETTPTPESSKSPEPTPSPASQVTPSPAPSPSATQSPTATETPAPVPGEIPSGVPRESPSPAASPAVTPSGETRPRRVKPPNT